MKARGVFFSLAALVVLGASIDGFLHRNWLGAVTCLALTLGMPILYRAATDDRL